MKTVVTILFILFAINAVAQIEQPTFGPTEKAIERSDSSAGDYLIRSGNTREAGTIIGLVGGVAGGYLLTKEDTRSIGLGLGIASTLVFLICEISADELEKKAGEMLNKNRVGITANGNGVGIRYLLSRR